MQCSMIITRGCCGNFLPACETVFIPSYCCQRSAWFPIALSVHMVYVEMADIGMTGNKRKF